MLGNLYGITLLNALVMDGTDGFEFSTQVNRAFDSVNIEDNQVVVDGIRLELQYLKDTFEKFVNDNKNKIKASDIGAVSLLGKKTNPEDTVAGIKDMVDSCGVEGTLTEAVLTRLLMNRKKILDLDLNRPTITINIYKLCNRPLSFFKDVHVSDVNVVINSSIEHAASKGDEAIAELVASSEESINSLESLTDSHSKATVSIYNRILDCELLAKITDVPVNEDSFAETVNELESLGFYGFNDITEELVSYIKGRIVSATQNEEFDEIVNSRPYIWFYRTILELKDSLTGIGEIPVYREAVELLSAESLSRLDD